MKKIWNLIKDEDGQEVVEYGVMAALIVGVPIAAVALLGTSVISRITSLATAIW